MAREQRELAKLIEQFQSTRDPGLQEKILRQVGALRNRMEELARRMAELQKSIRDEHYNLEALKEMARQQDMQGGSTTSRSSSRKARPRRPLRGSSSCRRR
jgi:hypothetical protein